jgi:hypothetical protein
MVALRYHTEFEHGAGDETFTIRFDGDNAQLAGYHLDSTAMMIN